MECARCLKILKQNDEVVLVRRGVWDKDLNDVIAYDYGINTPMSIVMCKACFQEITRKPAIKTKRVGFYADGDRMVPRKT